MVALSLRRAPAEHLDVLSLFVVGFGPLRQFEMRLDDVSDIAQDGGGALLTLLIGVEREPGGAAGVHGSFGQRVTDLRADLVAADAFEANWFEHVDPVDDPANGRLPVDGLKDAARRRRRDDVVADALSLHLGPGEARSRSTYPQLDAVGHIVSPCVGVGCVGVGSTREQKNARGRRRAVPPRSSHRSRARRKTNSIVLSLISSSSIHVPLSCTFLGCHAEPLRLGMWPASTQTLFQSTPIERRDGPNVLEALSDVRRLH